MIFTAETVVIYVGFYSSRKAKLMKFKLRTLRRPVTISGKSLFWPFDALITLSPPEKNDHRWLLTRGKREIPITPQSVVVSRWFRNLSVKDGRSTQAHVLEHLLPLRTMGLLGATVSSTHCLPYDGSMSLFLKPVLDACSEKEMDIPCATVTRQCAWQYPKLRNGHVGFTKILPRHDGKLVLNIKIDYPGLGMNHRIFEFPDDTLMKEISTTGAQGWPPGMYSVSKWAHACALWNHHRNIVWPQDRSSVVETSNLFMQHRCLDLLGALGLLFDTIPFSATVISHYSGHCADLHACRMASECRTTIS